VGSAVGELVGKMGAAVGTKVGDKVGKVAIWLVLGAKSTSSSHMTTES
jgi:hypothetical protein